MWICILFFVCFWIYLFDFLYKIDRLMGGGRPPLIKLSDLYEEIQKYIQKHTTNMQIHTNICKNVEKYMKKCYVRVGNRTLARKTKIGGRVNKKSS